MVYKDKENLKNKSIKLYLSGKTLQDISKTLKCSRNYIGKLIKDDPQIIEYRNTSKIKIIKQKNQKRMSIPISTGYLKKIGVSEDINLNEYVNITVNEKDKQIIIKKCKNSQ